MAYLRPEQITGQVLLNMHVNDRGQLVTSSNLNLNLKYDSSGTEISDGRKIYSKYATPRHGSANITLPSLDKLMNNVTEFTFAGWLYIDYPGDKVHILSRYISLSGDYYEEKLIASINNSSISISVGDTKDPWKHIAIVLHNRKIAFYINGIKQADVAYQEYHPNEVWKDDVWLDYYTSTDDICLILNQAVWTDNFTPPEEPLLGDLKYKTELYPENTIIAVPVDPGNLLVKLY